MKKLFLRIFLIFFILSDFIFIFSCKSLPTYAENFLKTEGSPLFLEERNSEENINGFFPNSIFIKTQTQTFSFEYDFLLNDGKIFYKKRGESSEHWKLFQKTGLPFSAKNKFESPKKIVEIAADADVLYAFSDEGKLFRVYTKKITHYTPFEWIDYFGWPEKIPLYQNSSVKNKKNWTIGSSRKDVLFYEDALGNQHHYGPLGVETITFLCEDGQTLRYCDPACPSDFSHTFKSPENGNFIAENLQESASTFFIISKNGKMYTRLVDYNTVGSNPMLYDYSYDEIYSDLEGSNPSSNTTIWSLPNEDWKIQPELPLGSKGTKFITIIQTGNGNSERELRIAALSTEGKTGFYHKKIYDLEWNFTEADLILPKSSFFTEEKNQQSDILQKYSGNLWKNGKKIENSDCSIENFHFSEGPFTVNFYNSDFKVNFYFSEIWTLFLRLKPGFEEEPIRYFGTAEFSKNDFANCKNKEIKLLFGNSNRKIHNFYIEAFSTYLKISFSDKKNLWEIYLTKDGIVKENPEIDRIFIQKNIQIGEKIQNQKEFYKTQNEFFKAENKINKDKKKKSAQLNALINTKKGNRSKFVELFSEKAAIFLQYSGEICRINKKFYKENYNLSKKFTKYLEEYNAFKKENPDFECLKAIKYFVKNQKEFENAEIIYFEELSFYPAFIVKTENNYILYELNSDFTKLQKYFLHQEKSVKFNREKLNFY